MAVLDDVRSALMRAAVEAIHSPETVFDGGGKPRPTYAVVVDTVLAHLEQVGWQWVDDGIADGGFVSVASRDAFPNSMRDDSRWKPVYRIHKEV